MATLTCLTVRPISAGVRPKTAAVTVRAAIAPDSAPPLALLALVTIDLGLWLLSSVLISAGDALWLRLAAGLAGFAAIFALGIA